MTNIPTETQIIFFLHFFADSSSPQEKRSFNTQIIRNMTAIVIKKFLILPAIVTNVFCTDSPQSVGLKKNVQISLLLNCARSVGSFACVATLVPLRRFISVFAVLPIAVKEKKVQRASKRIRNIDRKGYILTLAEREKKAILELRFFISGQNRKRVAFLLFLLLHFRFSLFPFFILFLFHSIFLLFFSDLVDIFEYFLFYEFFFLRVFLARDL